MKVIPKTLYKFRDWNNEFNRKMIIDSELYFANNDSLNDPFDLNLPTQRTSIPLDIPLVEHQMGRPLSNDEKNHVKKLHSGGKIKPPNFYNDVVDDLDIKIKKHEENHGVYCLTGNPKNLLMWGHYANSHEGLCIGLDNLRLTTFIKSKFGSDSRVKKVLYEDSIPVNEHGSNQQQIMTYLESRTIIKSKDWKYEDEYRIVLKNMAKKTLPIPSEVFSEIIFGFKMNQTRRKELTILCRTIYPHINFYEAIRSDKKFEMEIIPIN